jgi:hypothetical protein
LPENGRILKNYKIQNTKSEITNSPIGLKKTLSIPRRRRLNLSEGHPIVYNLGSSFSPFVVTTENGRSNNYCCGEGICNFPDKPILFGSGLANIQKKVR